MKKIALFCFLLFPLSKVLAQEQSSFQQIEKEFVDGVKSFDLPSLQLSYIENLKAISSEEVVEKQLLFFKAIDKKLSKVKSGKLNSAEFVGFKLMQYETKLNLERLALEQKWIKNKPDSITTGGLYHLNNGRQWYAYFLKKWTAANVTPDEIYKLGLAEIKRVNKHIEAIRLQTGYSEELFYSHLNDSSFFTNNESAIANLFEQAKKIVLGNLSTVFNVHSIPDLKITRGKNTALVQAPGYYDENTFYFNYYNKPYNIRQIDWLFIHEGIPGHHYQMSVAESLKTPAIQRLFWYPGYSEGWAAYTEEMGKELGLYKTVYDELGKWEWDIVRSVRVPLDVGINYYGWTDEQALTFWKKHIKNQDGIAMREINRIKRWPAQVVTYKYGAGKILEWKKWMQTNKGEKFDIKDFHDKILNSGSLPFPLLESILKL